MTKKRLTGIVRRWTAGLLLPLTLLLSSCGLIIIHRPGEETTAPPAREETTAPRTEPGETTPPDADTTHRIVEPTDYLSQAKAYLDKVARRNFDGIQTLIAVTDSTLFLPEEDNPYSAQVVKRNELVQARLNTSLVALRTDPDTLIGELKKAENAGDSYADLLAIPADRVGQYVLSGCLMSLTTLPFADFDQPYYNRTAVSQSTMGRAIWAAGGAATENVRDLSCVLFNRTLADELNLGSLYQTVYSGKWTWETFFALAKTAAEADGNGYVCVGDAGGVVNRCLHSVGLTYTENAFGQVPERTFAASEAIGSLLPLWQELIRDKANAAKTQDAYNVFWDGNTLFCLDRVGTLESLTDCGFAVGILPLPKADEEQKSYASGAVSGETLVLCVPAGNANIDNAGIALQALNAASYGYLSEGYYAYLQRDVVSDTDTLSMLDRLRETEIVDFTLMFGSTGSAIGKGTSAVLIRAIENADPAFTTLTSTEDAFRRACEALMP